MLKIMWKRGEIAPEEQFLLLFTIFCYLMSETRIRFSLRDKRLFEITELEITRVDCKCILISDIFLGDGEIFSLLKFFCENIQYSIYTRAHEVPAHFHDGTEKSIRFSLKIFCDIKSAELLDDSSFYTKTEHFSFVIFL